MVIQETEATKREVREKLIAELTCFIQSYKDEQLNIAELYKNVNLYGKMKYFSDIKGEFLAIIILNGESEPIKIKL